MADGVDLDRRRFLRGDFSPSAQSLRPPWSRDDTIREACTACGECAAACPQSIITSDVDGLPSVDFRTGECTFCGRCVEACPEAVFDRSLALAFEHVASIGGGCFAANGIVCQTCGDSCPEDAIRFRPRMGGAPLPILAADRCTGCGACIAACPADAIRTVPSQREAGNA